MSFLSKLSQLRKTTPPASRPSTTINNKPVEKKDDPTTYSLLPSNYVRDEDPAIRRLKELRRKEQLKNGDLLKKSSAHNKKRAAAGSGHGGKKRKNDADSEGGDFGTVYKRKVGSKNMPNRLNKETTIRREPVKKMSFQELMQQAETNATSKSKEKVSDKSLVTRDVKPEPRRLIKPGFKSRQSRKMESNNTKINNKNENNNNKILNKQHTGKDRSITKQSSSKEPAVRISLPKNKFAQPNDRIKKRLDSRKSSSHRHRNEYYEDDEVDSELDDFIEDDEEEGEQYGGSRYHQSRRDEGYDRDEIWAMFNKGKSRSEYIRHDYEDDYDDMEADEREILDEEEYATRMGKLEDKKEEAWLKKHDEEKKRKKRR